ncbi:unnamed protein product [Prorocentrum cordatum]|uniref:Uncharacterized protein n=1 Tax=Prorocentrum cordatum TaxID=2364126 RepID=A0ABN9QF41_9DINO|nr:unnamed protein product [Polarella glacialis]
MRCKLFGFNVRSLIQPRRLEEVALLAGGFPIHFLVGTRVQAVPWEAVLLVCPSELEREISDDGCIASSLDLLQHRAARRSTLVIFTGLIDSFAQDEMGNHFACVRPYAQSRMGNAARGFRDVQHRHHLACTITFRMIAPTYNGEKASSRTDHYDLPVGVLLRVSKLLTMTKAARQLQLFPSKGVLRDHSPVLLEMDLGAPPPLDTAAAAPWNFDATGTALQTPGLREGFLLKASEASSQGPPS